MIAFSGLVVTFNEERRLTECLQSLSFCEQVVVFDLGSSDRSREIARAAGAIVVQGRHEPIVEKIWPHAVQHVSNDWIVRLDPDEVFPPAAVDAMTTIIESDPHVGAVAIPHQYFFLGKPLTTTVWGGIRPIGKVFHRGRVILEPLVHQGMRLVPGFEMREVPAQQDDFVLRHYWADSVSDLVRKHVRYLPEEASVRARAGEHFAWRNLLTETLGTFRANFVYRSGWRQGILGTFLSLFHAWYVAAAIWRLRRVDRSNPQRPIPTSDVGGQG